MNEKINQLLSEGGKIYTSSEDQCIIEKNGIYYVVDKTGNVTTTQVLHG